MDSDRIGGNLSDGPLRILLVEANPADTDHLRQVLEDSPLADRHTLAGVETLAEAIAYRDPVDVVLLDPDLPDSQGLHTVDRFRREGQSAPLVLFVNLARKRMAADAVRDSAEDYFLKEDTSGLSLVNILERAIERYDQRTRLRGRRPPRR